MALGFLLLSLIGWGIYLFVAALVSTLASMQSDIAVAIVAAGSAIIVSVFSLVMSKRFEAMAVVRQELRAKKTPIYETIVKTLLKVHFAEKIGEKPPTEQELMQFFTTVTEQLIVWGSDEVFLEFRAFRMGSIKGARPIDIMFQYEKILAAIRKDLGHKNKGFKPGTILGMWVNDIDSYVG